ncbi:MAG: DUF6115 domain-containing protein [Campylobacterales bacterium]
MGLIEIAFVGGILGTILLLVAYMYVKDGESAKRFRSFEKSVEDINLQLYKVQKKLKESELESGEDKNEFRAKLRHEIKTEIEEIKSELISAIRELEKVHEDERIELEDKISILEDRVKESLYMSTSTTSVDESRIVSLFQSGYGIESIAKELNIGKGEVELTLKLANLR